MNYTFRFSDEISFEVVYSYIPPEAASLAGPGNEEDIELEQVQMLDLILRGNQIPVKFGEYLKEIIIENIIDRTKNNYE